MSKGKAPLATELVYLSALNKADIQKNLILSERDGSLYTQFFYDVLSVRISGQAADAPIRRKTSKRYIHAKVILGKLVNRCPSSHATGIF